MYFCFVSIDDSLSRGCSKINFHILSIFKSKYNIQTYATILSKMINGKQKPKEQKPSQPQSQPQGPKHTFVISSTKQCLQIDKNRVNFSKYPIFACSHKFIAVNVQLLDFFTEMQKKQFHMLSIRVETLVKEHGEVFTFKLVEGGEEVTHMEVPIKVNQPPMPIIVKANMPELQSSTDINGNMILQVDNFAPLVLPINSRGEVPSIVCLKEMVNEKTGFKIIKIPSKGTMNIPFKNCSNINFFFEVKLLSRDEANPDSDGVKLRVTSNPNQPKIEDDRVKKQTILKVDANSTFFVGLSFELLKKDGSIRISRRLLIMQVQGTKLFFTFPLELIIYE